MISAISSQATLPESLPISCKTSLPAPPTGHVIVYSASEHTTLFPLLGLLCGVLHIWQLLPI